MKVILPVVRNKGVALIDAMALAVIAAGLAVIALLIASCC